MRSQGEGEGGHPGGGIAVRFESIVRGCFRRPSGRVIHVSSRMAWGEGTTAGMMLLR